MQKPFNFLMVGLTFAVLNVATVAVALSLTAANSSINHNGKTPTPSTTVAGKIIFVYVSLIIPTIRVFNKVY